MEQYLDSKGKVHYLDDNGKEIKGNVSLLNQVANNLKAMGTNFNSWINETNPESSAYKQKVNTALALTTLPMGAGAKATQAIAKPLVPYVGKQIAKNVAQGVGAGAVSGGVEGVGRGLIEGENPILTGVTDALLGASFGGLGGFGAGQFGKYMAKKNLVGNPEAQINFARDYLEGLNDKVLTKQGFGMNDIRGLKTGNYGNLEGETLYNFIGENAENADRVALNKAQELFNQGVDNESIRQQTGWFKGVDGKWRYEIPDGKFEEDINWNKLLNSDQEAVKLKEIYNNPELYNAYPEFADIDVVRQSLSPYNIDGTVYKYKNNDKMGILLDNGLFKNTKYNMWRDKIDDIYKTPEGMKWNKADEDWWNNRISDEEYEKAIDEFYNTETGKLFDNLRKNEPEITEIVDSINKKGKKTLIHELQHLIQHKEGFASGGNQLNKNYGNLAGEVESRLAEQRFGLTPEQKLNTPLNYDVPIDKQIVEFDNKTGLYNKLANNKGVVDLTNSFSKNPTIAEVKAHIQNLINNGIKYDTLSPDWKIDIIGGKAKADHIVKSSQYGKMNKSKVNRHNKYIASIEDLINNSTYSSSKTNTKIVKKPNIDTYHYFETNVKIGNKQYKVILNAEQFKGESTIKPQTVHLYDVLEIK